MRRRLRAAAGRGWFWIGVLLTIAGLPGVPGDLAMWLEWLSAAADLDVAERFFRASAEALAWLDRPGSSITLAALGVAILMWNSRWFARVRYKARMAGRSLMADEVWLSEVDAMEALKQSDWAMLRIPHVTETVPAFDLATITGVLSGTRQRTVAGISDAEKARKKYVMFLGRTLRSFAESNPKAAREVDGKHEYERGALLAFLEAALEDELSSEFGEVPRYRVTD